MKINFVLNGQNETWDIEARETLLDVVRREGLTGTKRVCESGECGACAVLVDGLAVDSCILLAAQVDGSEITTVEGLATPDKLHPVQEAFARNGAIQCGFCTPGMVVTAVNLLAEIKRPTEEQVRHAFVGNLCRCTGYKKPIEAVMQAAAQGDQSED